MYMKGIPGMLHKLLKHDDMTESTPTSSTVKSNGSYILPPGPHHQTRKDVDGISTTSSTAHISNVMESKTLRHSDETVVAHSNKFGNTSSHKESRSIVNVGIGLGFKLPNGTTMTAPSCAGLVKPPLATPREKFQPMDNESHYAYSAYYDDRDNTVTVS